MSEDVSKPLVRQLVIDVLDDENGVNETVYNSIIEICTIHGWIDIIQSIDSTDGRYYISSTRAKELLFN